MIRPSASRILIPAICCLLGGCSGYEVFVKSSDNWPIQGVQVRALGLVRAGSDATTDLHGTAKLTPGDSKPLWLYLRKLGYGEMAVDWPQHWPATVTFPSGQHLPSTFTGVWAFPAP